MQNLPFIPYKVPLADITLNQLKEINIDFSAKKLLNAEIQGFHAATLMKSGVIFCSEYNNKEKY